MGDFSKHNKEQEIVTNYVFHQVGQQTTTLQMLNRKLKITQTLNVYSNSVKKIRTFKIKKT